MKFDIMQEVLNEEKYMLDLQKYFHKYPEPSNFEDETVKKIINELENIGIDYIDVEHGGILAFLKGKNSEKTVLLRADIDALQIEEDEENLSNKKQIISDRKGLCHACGHDGHTAMLLTAIKILYKYKDMINGNIIFMFERGEEGTGNYVYLYKYIRDNNIHIDSSYGIHLYSGLESGKIAINTGNVMSGAITLNFILEGRGGHGSRPDEAINPIDCFVAIYNGMSTLRTRKIIPFTPFTDVIGEVHSGTAGNIIPNTISFNGGARFFEMDEAIKYKSAIKNMVENISKAYNCKILLADILGPMLPVKNDPECAELARRKISEVLGKEKIIEIEPWMASDSMGYHLALWPGVYSLVGIKNIEKGTGALHHNSKFEIDQDVLKYGAVSSIVYALSFLESDIETSRSPFIWKDSMLDLLKITGRKKSWIQVLE
ncbi:MAG: amidohydrolase [Fusobacterium sp.]|uniref:amidohydrolase n=1 Tax=Fusobacterium sp. TaxID=68766 RepID=UPI0026DBD0EF|nr:amidohydrolase [Fusobacterium sp.]MDO4690399.1 amidohydrolase [Fusobacterium sp.]